MIEEAWKDYEAKVIPADASEIQRTESRRAFYAGAVTVFGGVVGGIKGDGGAPTPADLALLTNCANELKAYRAEVAKDAERCRNIEAHPKRPELGPLDKTCNRNGCGEPSKWQIALVFFAAGHTQAHQGLVAEMGLALCDVHGKAATAADFLTDEGFAQVCHAMRMIGKAAPERALTKVKLLPILMGRA